MKEVIQARELAFYAERSSGHVERGDCIYRYRTVYEEEDSVRAYANHRRPRAAVESPAATFGEPRSHSPVANRTEHTYESGGADPQFHLAERPQVPSHFSSAAIKASAKSPVYNADTASSTLAHLKADSTLDAASRDASSSMDSKSEDLVRHPDRFMKLDEKPHVVNPISQDPQSNLPEKPQVVNTANAGSLQEAPTRYQLPQTVSSPKPPVHVLSKPHVVDVIQNPTINLAARPQVLFGPSRDPTYNVAAKPQVVNPSNEPSVNVEAKPQVLDPDTNPLGNYKEKPNTLKATYPGPYGGGREPVPVPQVPSSSTKAPGFFDRRPQPPTQQKYPARPAPPTWPAFSRPPHGYGFAVGNVQVPPTPRPPGCFYKSERYEHGDVVSTPEPCLNCTCQKGVLVCYLRVCPTTGTPAPGCFTAREAGECCPNVFCSGEKKTTTTPPPPLDDDYYDYSATVDYGYDSEPTTPKSKPPKPAWQGPGYDDSELSARTPSIISETETVTLSPETTTFTFSTSTATSKHPGTSTVKSPSREATTTKTASPSTSTQTVTTVTHMETTVTTESHLATTTVQVNGTTAVKNDVTTHPSRRPETTTFGTTGSTRPALRPTSVRDEATTKKSGDDTEETETATVVDATTVFSPTATTEITLDTTTSLEEQATRYNGNLTTGVPTRAPEAAVREPVADDEAANSVEAGDHTARDSVMLVSSTPLPYEVHHSFDLQDLNTISGACLDEASLYAEGSAMLSSNFCNYCYCIRGIKRCVQPKCHLAVADCQPQFTSQYDCCPSSYACTQGPANATTPLPLIGSTATSTTTTQMPVIIPIQGCLKKGQLYKVGEAVPGTTDCEACYCSPRGPTCHRIECPPVALDCDPVIPKGHCCPTEYICNKTQLYKDREYDKPAGFNKDLYHPQALPDDYQDNQPLARKSDDNFDYNSVPQPAYKPPTTQETFTQPESSGAIAAATLTEKNRTADASKDPQESAAKDSNVLASLISGTMASESNTSARVGNETRDEATTTTAENTSLLPSTALLPKKGEKYAMQMPSFATTHAPTPHKNRVIYIPELIHTPDGGKLMTELKIEMKPTPEPSSPSHPFHQEKIEDFFAREPLHDTAVQGKQNVQPKPQEDLTKGLPPVPLEGLQFSELIDRLFFTGSEDDKNGKDVPDDVLEPAYGQAHLYNASAQGTSVIEARYPLDENDKLQPVYGSPPVFHKPTADLLPGEAESLKPRYGKPPSFEDESPKDLLSRVHVQTTTPEVHYEPAASLDVDTSSHNVNASTEQKLSNHTLPTSVGQRFEPAEVFRNVTRIGSKGPHRFLPSLKPGFIPDDEHGRTSSSESQDLPDKTRTGTSESHPAMTPNRTMFEDEMFLGDNPHIIHDESAENKSTATTTASDPSTSSRFYEVTPGMHAERDSWETGLYNFSTPTAHSFDSVTTAIRELNEVVPSVTEGGPQSDEASTTTSMINVRLGNTLNVSVDGNQSMYRNVEEGGIIVSMYPEHRMDGNISEMQEPPHAFSDPSDQVASRAISSRNPVKDVQRAEEKVKALARPTEVISDVAKPHKADEPEVITAPNIDFSQAGTMNVRVSPGNAFKVFSTVVLDAASKIRHGTATTEPPVDTAPWAPLGSTITDSGESVSLTSNPSGLSDIIQPQASSTIQMHNYPSSMAPVTTDGPTKPAVVHSSFRIVPFLAEDAIFKPATPAHAFHNETAGRPKITVNSNPREPVRDNCFVAGRMFINGELIKKADPCELCRCYYGRELCQQKNCPLPPSPACISESVPGFCCPKYTCRPQDVYLPPPDVDTAPPDHVTSNGPTTHPTQFSLVDVDASAEHAKQPTPGNFRPVLGTTTPPAPSFSVKNSPVLKPFFLQRTTVQTMQGGFAPTAATEREPIDDPATTTAETTPSPTTTSTSGPQQLWNVFQVSGCNIYGRLYGVNEVVRELSSKCKACTCTSLGVQCNDTC
ncbi:mucin-17 [Ixodes scapularis]|uniref:mucin-17 n=1 Tax=Ixodes scapularis TaxID=6945 RepID=UPI001C38F8D3|nr:mucin-17 [Ixodes scapularis]